MFRLGFFSLGPPCSNGARCDRICSVATCTLSELVPQADYTTLSDVKITGTVDARDFFFIRDNLTRISTVDMTEATIAACEVEGVAYEADAIPANAFSLPQESTGMARMTTFEAPLSTRVIGDNAFYLCNVLRETNIGSLQELQYIGSGAFRVATVCVALFFLHRLLRLVMLRLLMTLRYRLLNLPQVLR